VRRQGHKDDRRCGEAVLAMALPFTLLLGPRNRLDVKAGVRIRLGLLCPWLSNYTIRTRIAGRVERGTPAAELQQKTDDILGKLSAKTSQSLVPAMSTYMVERVCS